MHQNIEAGSDRCFNKTVTNYNHYITSWPQSIGRLCPIVLALIKITVNLFSLECVSHQDSCEYCRIEFDLMIHYKNDHHRLDKGYCSFCFWFECLLHRKLNMTTNFQRKTNHRELKSKDLVRLIQRQSLYSSLMKDVGIDKSVKLLLSN